MSELLFYKEVGIIQGAVFDVFRELGPGFLEAVYQEALQIELEARAVPFEAQKKIAIQYKGRTLRQPYVADIVCHGGIILELKAVDLTSNKHLAQVINYLRATGMELGLLVNFGPHKATVQRVIRRNEAEQ
jgi:GxxExxY protein